MRNLFLAATAAISLAACADGVLRLPSPGDVGGLSTAQTRLAEFCATDFAQVNAAALGEWIGLYNVLAPLIDQDPIAADGLYQNEAVAKLFAVRSAVCLATQPLPAPAVVEILADAE